ncbi:unnamed protein product [Musa textilis]
MQEVKKMDQVHIIILSLLTNTALCCCYTKETQSFGTTRSYVVQ